MKRLGTENLSGTALAAGIVRRIVGPAASAVPLMLVLASLAMAAEGVPLEDAPPSGAEGVKYFYQQAKAYQVKLGDSDQPLKLIESPLLNWTNPARTNENGIIVVWLKEGRPEALATMFTYQFGQRVYEKHELVSLCEKSLSATFNGRRAWEPKAAGLDWKPLVELAPPAANNRLLTLQMRQIAREFTGSLYDAEKQTTELRQLPKPLYVYEETSGDLLGGAIFTLNVGTDPEVLIVIEAVRSGGTSAWRYALARLNYNQLTVQHRGKLVWNQKAIPELMNDLTGQAKYMADPYFTYYPQTLMKTGAAAP